MIPKCFTNIIKTLINAKNASFSWFISLVSNIHIRHIIKEIAYMKTENWQKF